MLSLDMKMAWRNVWRNPRRTWLTLAAIGFACIVLIFMLSFQFGSYATMINSSIKINSGHLQVQARGYFEKNDIHHVVGDPAPILKMISSIKQVEAVTTRDRAFSLITSKNHTYGGLVIGIDPANEAKVSTIKHLIRSGRFLSEPAKTSAADEAIVGSLLAKNLNVGIGDHLTILGQGRDGSVAAAVLSVVGIYESGIDEFDRNTLQIPIQTFQSVFSMGNAVNEIVINVRSLEDVSHVKSEIIKSIRKMPGRKNLVVLDWEQLVPGLIQSIKIDLTIGVIFWFLLVMVVAFSILNTFLMAIFERTREFGIMMAMGTTPFRLVKLMLYESNTIAAAGIFLGVLVGCCLTLIFQIHGIDMSGSSEILRQYGISGRIYPRLSWVTACAGPLLVWTVTQAVALYPALRIRTLKPVDAMRHV